MKELTLSQRAKRLVQKMTSSFSKPPAVAVYGFDDTVLVVKHNQRTGEVTVEELEDEY